MKLVSTKKQARVSYKKIRSSTLEGPIQTQVMQFLTFRKKSPLYREFWRRTNVIGVPTGKVGSNGKPIYRPSSMAGAPDIEGVIEGFYVGVELKKNSKGKLTDSQKKVRSDLMKAGAFIFKCSSLREVEESLKQVYAHIDRVVAKENPKL